MQIMEKNLIDTDKIIKHLLGILRIISTGKLKIRGLPMPQMYVKIRENILWYCVCACRSLNGACTEQGNLNE